MQEHKRIATDAYFVLNPLELQLHFPPSVTTLSVFHLFNSHAHLSSSSSVLCPL